MKAIRTFVSCVALGVTPAAIPAFAEKMTGVYSDAELEASRALYEPILRSYLRDVILPLLSPGEASALRSLELSLPLSLPDEDPLGFYAAGDTISLSIASIRFMTDLSLAAVWLSKNNYSPETPQIYTAMLKYGRFGPSPPQPLSILCIPPGAIDDPNLTGQLGVMFESTILFIMLHEVAHVLYGHSLTPDVDPATSREREAEADRYAIDRMRALGMSPVGNVPYLMALASMAPNRADYESEAEYSEYLAKNTHPLHSTRIAGLAAMLSEEPAAGVSVRMMLGQLAEMMRTGGVQDVIVEKGRTALPVNLAPHDVTQFLGPPCDWVNNGQPFTGLFDGRFITRDGGEVPMSLLLFQKGEQVNGVMSSISTTYLVEGAAVGNSLAFRYYSGDFMSDGSFELGGDGNLTGEWRSRPGSPPGTAVFNRRAE